MIYHQSFKIKLTSSIYIAKTSLPEYVTSTSTDVPTVLLLYTQNRMITDRAKFYTVQFNNYLKATMFMSGFICEMKINGRVIK